MKSQYKRHTHRFYIALGFFFVILSLLAWFLTFRLYAANGYPPAKEELSMLSQWGDWIGGVTAPFLNVAGFIMIYVAFRQQSVDSRANQLEFQIQRFESTYFNLIQLHHQNIQHIQNSFLKSRSGESHFFQFARNFLLKNANQNFSIDKIRQLYLQLYEKNYNYIDPFARQLLFMIDYVMNTKAFQDHPSLDSEIERAEYLKILIAQLSLDELTLLYYHSLFDPSGFASQHQEQLQRFNFFDRLLGSDRLLAPEHKHWYTQKIPL